VAARSEGEGPTFPPGYRLTAFSGGSLVAWRPDGWPIGSWSLAETSFGAAERAAWSDWLRLRQLAPLTREG
jgi:hypothetical protein